MLFLGSISSIFDYVTYGTLISVFGAWTNPPLFQTGWFVESLLTQTLIIHIIRTARISFLQSRASNSLIVTTILVAGPARSFPIPHWAPRSGLCRYQPSTDLPLWLLFLAIACWHIWSRVGSCAAGACEL
jgi:P-type Mg2+ transporter